MNLSKKLLFMALASCAALPAVAKDAQVGTGETNGYRLVWQDLFDDPELRPDRWNIEVNGSGGGNNELQFYTDLDRNVRLGDDGKGNHKDFQLNHPWQRLLVPTGIFRQPYDFPPAAVCLLLASAFLTRPTSHPHYANFWR